MFWIHGGALALGSSFQYQYNGSALAAHDVVVVSMNYRLAQFGFLYGGDDRAPGNQGFYDQLLALKWVRENIYKFGGDRDQITIFGQSAVDANHITEATVVGTTVATLDTEYLP
ncbi:unnamed protein product, partial [Oppiella nova]